MNLGYNQALPQIMYVDLNSCFATVEQQARPRLRGRPVAVVNRICTDSATIITASYEAKARGVKVGMRVGEARRLAPGLVAVESDPPKYRYVYHKLLAILNDYSAHVRMKSIDEGMIDFSETSRDISRRDLMEVGREIKERLWGEIGCAMNCNIGIGTNRFLAKTAASLNKPNGLDVITHRNIRQTLQGLELEDLTGIARKNRQRLNAVGIYTPLEFLDADPIVLQKIVFKSICGLEWHQRMRGWEVDKRDFPMRSAGRQYVLEGNSMNRQAILQRLHHLCESVGQKIRSQGLVARGVQVHVRSRQSGYWQARHMSPLPFFSNQAIYSQASSLFEQAPDFIKEIGVSCYQLSEDDDPQFSLFGDQTARQRQITQAIDDINYRYGGRSIHSADTLGTDDYIKQKIPFGSTRYL